MQDLQGHLEQWFPNGKRRGREYLIGNLRGDPGESLSINLDTGAWQDFGDLTEPKGKDALGLYAMAFCGGGHKAGRTAACKELAGKLGIEGGAAPAGGAKVVHLNPKSKKEGTWTPIFPPPDGVRAPDLTGKDYEHIHTYRDAAGQIVRYVGRYTTREGRKGFAPWTYGTRNGKTGWHPKMPNPPMCLFGLDARAARPQARVLVQEGELKTERVGELLGGAWCCMAWSGGHNRVLDHDWTPLIGADVVLCGDHDAVGRRAITRLADHLRQIGAATVTVIDLTGMDDGWDLGDAVKEGCDAAWIESFLKDRARDRLDDPESGDDLEADDVEPDGVGPDEKDPKKMPPLPLGYDNGIYFYLSPLTNQIEALTRARHKKDDLIGIAGLEFFEGMGERFQGEKGPDWTRIKNHLQNQCHRIGFYNPDRVRRRGAYLDEGRAVLNCGDRLIVDGKSLPLILPGSTFIYEGARRLNYTVAEPIGPEQASQLLEICKLFPWERPISATLMAGWLVVAPICGALFWRPSIWITGGSGSGKSTLEKLVMKPALGDIGLFLKGGTTEAGVRQKMGRDARPLCFDEAESENPKAKGIIQGLLELNRQSSSDDGAEIIKGTQSQTGAKTYHVRSCFAFSSINPMIEHLADESRVTVLELRNPRTQKPEEFEAMAAHIIGTMTPDFSAGLIARNVALMRTILTNAATFSRAVAVHLGSSRVGDQIGTMLAGAYALERNGEVSFDTALAWVKKQDWSNTTSADAAKDEERLTMRLLQRRIKIDLGDKVIERTVGEALEEAAKDTGTGGGADLLARTYQDALKRCGLKVDGDGVWISNTHDELKAWLKDSPWSSQWGRSLKRIPGAKTSEPKVIVFGTHDRAKAVWLPFSAFDR